MKYSFAKTSLAVAAASFVLSAHSALVFDNGAPNQIYGVNMSANWVAEDFTLAANTTITNIRFWSIQSAAGDYSGSLSLAIYADVGGAIGGLVTSFSGALAETATGLSTSFGYGEYVFDIPGSIALSAGNYWLALLDGLSPSPVTPNEILWETTAVGLGSKAQYLDDQSQTWVDSGSNLAFRIDGREATPPPPPPNGVPAPNTLALLVASVLAASALRRKA